MENKSIGKSGVYAIKNLVNGKLYIGSTSDFKARCRGHRTLLKRRIHFSKRLQNAVDKYGLENFEFITLKEFTQGVDQSYEDFITSLRKEEETLITQYRSNNKQFGYNTRIECTTNLGTKWSIEAREALSKSKKGKPLSDAALTALANYFTIYKR